MALNMAVKGGRLLLAGAGTMLISGIFVSLIGVFTEADKPLHSAVTDGGFYLLFVSVILVGASFVHTGMRRKGYATLGAATVTFFASEVAYYGPFFTAHRCAAGEWAFVLGVSAWLMWMGRTLLKS